MDSDYKYDVAISFAEEDRNAAQLLVNSFKVAGLIAYFYPDAKEVVLGQQLEQMLTDIYTIQARYAVVLFSEKYMDESKTYTQIELAAIQNRMKQDAGQVYMIPVKLTRDISLKKYPDLNGLIYADWDNKPDQIATDISILLGRKLASPTDVTDGSSIVYNSGMNQSVIVDYDFSGFGLDTLKKPGGGSIIIVNKDGEEFKFSKLKKGFYACPFCSFENEFEKYGINECMNEKCKASFYIPNNDFTILPYRSIISADETREFNKIRARIVNSIIGKDYDAAHKYCIAAERLAPAEPATWEHFAMTEFLIEIYKEARERLSAKEIIKNIRPHLERCKKHGIPDERFDGLLIEVANKLFAIEKARIRSLRASYIDKDGNEIWTRSNLFRIKDYLNSFEVCYSLYENIMFLEEYVSELSKPYKWLVKTIDNEIKSTIDLGNFRAVDKYKSLVAKIQLQHPGYDPPGIEQERFERMPSDDEIIGSVQIISRIKN